MKKIIGALLLGIPLTGLGWAIVSITGWGGVAIIAGGIVFGIMMAKGVQLLEDQS